jgi:hypothetical protein
MEDCLSGTTSGLAAPSRTDGRFLLRDYFRPCSTFQDRWKIAYQGLLQTLQHLPGQMEDFLSGTTSDLAAPSSTDGRLLIRDYFRPCSTFQYRWKIAYQGLLQASQCPQAQK